MKVKVSLVFMALLLSGMLFQPSYALNNEVPGKCNLVITYAEMALVNFKKAYKSESSEEITSLLEKAVSECTQASAYAINEMCNCSLAKNYALNGVTFGNKALKAKNDKDRKKYIKQAMNAASSVMVGANTCN